MRILYTASIEYGPHLSTGGSVHIHNVVRLLRERGHEVIVFACEAESAPGGAVDKPHTEYLGTLPSSLFTLIRFNRTFWKRLEQRQRSQPKANVLYSRFGVWQFSPILFARKRKIPLVIEVNGIPDQDRRLGWLHERIIRWMLRSANRIVVVADRMGEHFTRRYEIPQDRFVTVKNGVDCELYRPLGDRRREYVPEGRPVIGYAGSLGPYWDLDLLWKAAPRILEQFPDALFVVAGEGPMEGPLKENFERVGLASHLLMLGPLAYGEAGQLMAECDVLAAFLKPTARNEMSSPVKVYHSLAVGVPTVASDIHVMKQFEGSGLVTFKPGDPEAFAEAVIRCLNLPSEDRKRLGQQGRGFIEQHYTWEHTVSCVEEVIESVVKAAK